MFLTKKKEEKYVREIANLKHEIKELTDIVKTQELLKLREENRRLKEKESLISNVKFCLKSVGYIQEDDTLLVKYEIPNIKLGFDNDRNLIKNELFYSINKLQLISLKDMKKIQSALDEIKKIK